MGECPACGAGLSYSGFGRPRKYCNNECRNTARRAVREKHKPPRPLPKLNSGPPPYVWEVEARYLVTSKDMWPRHSGPLEQRRCGIIADFADRDTAEKFADRVRKQRWDLYKKNGLHSNISA